MSSASANLIVDFNKARQCTVSVPSRQYLIEIGGHIFRISVIGSAYPAGSNRKIAIFRRALFAPAVDKYNIGTWSVTISAIIGKPAVMTEHNQILSIYQAPSRALPAERLADRFVILVRQV